MRHISRLFRPLRRINHGSFPSSRPGAARRRWPLALLPLVLFLGTALPVNPAPEPEFIIDNTGFIVRHLDNGRFGLGERFLFDVNYGVITAGEAGIEILPDLETYRGAPCYHIHTWARSSKTFSRVFKVDDQVHSYMDTRGMFTWYFEKRLNEGKYHDVKVVDYDQRLGKAYTFDEGVPQDTSDIPLYVQDAISSLYYFRLLPEIEVGKSYHVEVHDIHKTYPLRVDVLEREKVKVPAGEFWAYKVEPVLESAGIFKQKGRIFIWFSDDEYRFPVQMQSKVLIGAISAELKEFSTGTPVTQK
ncbi:MAG: DUF3108 domain-containing protein [Candidatus Zixiibacteriota bacterium]|nr:MAG: DUF3108 domain-containing protein [candidate division Zixibacteria bacterium]